MKTRTIQDGNATGKARITPLHGITAAVCAYETAAIVARSPRLPTITHLQTKQPFIGAALVAALTVHFFRADRTNGS